MRIPAFARDNWRLLAFGLVLNFFSSSGQTYFISIFGGEIRSQFGLSNGDFGAVYSLATLGGAALLVWVGRFIDRVDLRLYALAVCLALAAANLYMAEVWSVAALISAVVVLRLTGQGLMTHTAVTTVSRYLKDRRGTAVGIISAGITLGVASFPVIGVALMEGLGWRQAWTAVGIAYLVLLPGLVLWLLRGHGDRHRAFTAHHAKVRAVSTDGEFTVGKVLHDRRFYLILPAFTAPTILFTGFIFHQVHLAASKGWTLTWFASWFFAYAGISMLTSFLLGPVLDRLNARRLTPFFLIPFGFAMILLATTAHPLSAPAVMVLLGVGVGCFYTIFGAYWAEVYGVTHLGAIRSVTHAVTVLASATSPFLFGWLIDGGLSIETLALLCLGYAAAASVLAALASRQTQAAVENA